MVLQGLIRRGRFVGRTKDWCFMVLMSCDYEILEALASRGTNNPSPEIHSQLERLVCMLYRSKVYTKGNYLCLVFILKLCGRWRESFPPTTSLLTSHIRRVHDVTMIWRKAGESHLCLLSPVECGWNFDAATCHFAPVR